MAYTFLKAQGYEIGKSLCDDSKIDYCKEMMAKAQAKGVKLLLPIDTVCIDDFPDPIDAPVSTTVVPVTAMPADKEGCDIGPETTKLFADAVKASKTVVWNGPMGVFENPTWPPARWPWAKAMAEERRHHRHRRRRQRGGCAADGPGRQDDPHLHRRRRLAGVPRGQRAARYRRHPERVIPRRARRRAAAPFFLRAPGRRAVYLGRSFSYG